MKGSPHNGIPIEATEVVAPVAATTAGRYTFPTAARPCLFTNLSGQNAYVKINPLAADGTTWDTDPDDSALLCHKVVSTGDGANNPSLDLSEGGLININSLSIWYPTSAVVANTKIFGWV